MIDCSLICCYHVALTERLTWIGHVSICSPVTQATQNPINIQQQPVFEGKSFRPLLFCQAILLTEARPLSSNVLLPPNRQLPTRSFTVRLT